MNVPSGERHMASEAFERLNIGICKKSVPFYGLQCGLGDLAERTGEDVPLKMFVSSERLPAIGAEHHGRYKFGRNVLSTGFDELWSSVP